MKKIIVCSVLLCLFLYGCDENPLNTLKDNYQIIKGEDGVVYRLNKKTGEMAVIEGNKITKLETSKDRVYKQMTERTLQEPKDWGEQQIAGKKLKTKLITSWRDNKIYYKYTLFPYESLKRLDYLRINDYRKYSWQKLNVGLYDINGFLIKNIEVFIKDMSNIVNENGERIYQEINSNTELSKSDYESIFYCSNMWVLDGDLIPDDTAKTKYLQDFDLDITEKAFMDALWGMSEEQVKEVNNTELIESEINLAFLYPQVADMQRYKNRVQKNIETMDGVEIYYSFFDNKLFELRIIKEGTEPDEIDKSLMAVLSKKYGEGKPSKKRDCDIKSMEWENEITSVIYWLMENEETKDYLGGLKLTSKPIYEQIESISDYEEKNKF